MDFKVVWTEPAVDDLRNICLYIANQDADASQKIGGDILNHVELLAKFPFIGTTYPRSSPGQVREIICRS
jgi:plasmid stabilization system protein ParE